MEARTYKIALESPKDQRDMRRIAVLTGNAPGAGKCLSDGRYHVSVVMPDGEVRPGHVLYISREGKKHVCYLQDVANKGEPRLLDDDHLQSHEFIFWDMSES